MTRLMSAYTKAPSFRLWGYSISMPSLHLSVAATAASSTSIPVWCAVLSLAAPAIVYATRWRFPYLFATDDFKIVSGGIHRAVMRPERKINSSFPNGEEIPLDGLVLPGKVVAESDAGSLRLKEEEFNELERRFGPALHTRFLQAEVLVGDTHDKVVNIPPHDTIVDPSEDPRVPVSGKAQWKNPVKGFFDPSVGTPLTEAEAAALGLPDYPEETGLKSGRVLGFTRLRHAAWSSMCSRLYQTHDVNVILVHMKGRSRDAAVSLRRYWGGGKGNDVVICYDENRWVYVFGWFSGRSLADELERLLAGIRRLENRHIELVEEIIRDEFVPFEWDRYRGGVLPVSVSMAAKFAAMTTIAQLLILALGS